MTPLACHYFIIIIFVISAPHGIWSHFFLNAYSKVYSTVLHLYIHTRFHFFLFLKKLYHFRRNRFLKWSHMTNILKCLHILYWEIVNFFSFCLLFRKPKYCCFYAKTLVLKRLSEHMLTHECHWERDNCSSRRSWKTSFIPLLHDCVNVIPVRRNHYLTIYEFTIHACH